MNLFPSKEETSFMKEQYSLKDFVKHLDLNKPKLKKIEYLLHGLYQSLRKGEGFDFNEVREYIIGDDLRHISWSTTAKTGTLHTKEYFGEKEIRTFFILDISNSVFCGNKLETTTNLLAFLLHIACNFSEKIGGLFFSEDIKYNFPFVESNIQANIIFKTFLNMTSKIKEKIIKHPTMTNMSLALDFTKRYFQKKGLLFLISDFISIKNWEKSVYLTSEHQNIYTFQVYDETDIKLPKSGIVKIVDPETYEEITVNTDSKLIRDTYNKLALKKIENISNFLKGIEVHHITVDKSDFN